MQYKIFTIPIHGGQDSLVELNRFLRSEKIITVDKNLVVVEGNAFWSFCIQFIPDALVTGQSSVQKNKTDYKSILSSEHFEIFSVLRTIRKQIAAEDAVPAYSVFTDAELAAIASLPVIDVAFLKDVDGVGIKRVEKYGELLVKRYHEASPLIKQ